MLLNDLTVDEYLRLREIHKTEKKVAEALFVSDGTLWKWKNKNGLTGIVFMERAKKRHERVGAYKELIKLGKGTKEIVEELNFTSKENLYDWVSKRRREGYFI